MAGRDPRPGGRQTPDPAREAAWDAALVHVQDLAGRPRGTGFVADHHGTLVTSHEAVDGLARLVLHASGGRTRVVSAEDVTALPEVDLALVRTEGLGVDPLPVTVRDHVGTGAYVRIAAGGLREARVLGATAVTYAATDRFHLLDGALELAIGTAGADALRLGGGAAGGPVVDIATGAVVAVLGTALQAGHRAAGLAVPLRGAAREAGGPLAELLDRNAATVAAYGADLNPAGVLELTATSVGSNGPVAGGDAGPADVLPGSGASPIGSTVVERADVIREFAAFEAGSAAVLGLVGPPGSGRTTELAALAARRARGPAPAPTLWLRGADLLASDVSVADAAARALERAGRIVASSGAGAAGQGGGHPGFAADAWGLGDGRLSRSAASDVLPPGGYEGELGDIGPDRLASLAHLAGRPLLLLLDGPEEMPPVLAHRLPEWTAGTAAWLREAGARLVVACRAEYWEQAGAHVPRELLHGERGLVGRAWSRAERGLVGQGLPHGARGPGGRGSLDGERGVGGDRLPHCVRLGDLGEEAAREARSRYGIPDGVLPDADARHPLTLRLLSEVRAALPDGALGEAAGPACRDEVFAAHLDLMCLRIAVRLAAANGLRGAAVRRLAARVSGQVHEAARRCLGPGQGELDRASFESVFPWGPAPGRRLGATPGWASAVLTEGLLVPAGNGYRFAHEELADWIQGMHLDLDAALHALVHRGRDVTDEGPLPSPRATAAARRRARAARQARPAGQAHHMLPVPRHRIGPVAEALLLLARQHGTAELALRLEDLVDALDALVPTGADPGGDSVWWAARLLGEVLPRVPDATPYAGVLRLLAGRIVRWRQQGRVVPGEFGPWFWETVRLPEAERFDLLRRLVVADEAPGSDVRGAASAGAGSEARTEAGRGSPPDAAGEPSSAGGGASRGLDVVPEQRGGDPRGGDEAVRRPRGTPADDSGDTGRALDREAPEAGATVRHVPEAGPPATEPRDTPRYLDAVARLLVADPTAVQPHLTRWFDDERPLPATPDATVAAAAQALLYAHRRRALDDLAEALVGSAHRRGDELLAVLAEEEPSAVCRAVDRWAHDERPARRVAAMTYGLRAAPHVRTEADRELLRYAALALLARPADCTLHGAALALLVRDPETRARYLPRTLERFVTGDPQLPASALVAALATHPEPVLAAFRTRLRQPGPDAGDTLRTLADVTTPDLARRVALLVRQVVELRPEAAGHVAAYVDRRLEHGPGARAVLLPLVTGLLDGGPLPARTALAPVLAVRGSRRSRALRHELRELLLTHERDPAVLDALLSAAAAGAAHGGDTEDARELVRRTGLLLVRTPAGATRFDRGLVDLARELPGFAALLAGWLTDAPQDWSAVVGPSARRMIENLAGVRVPA
ncbi:trypsin-like peptidase domain-containing protein [Streptomyces sp. NPDC058371]|uniref:trypsin-like peptidase domain-containing protein n=1 Tax=Streptomyces sp. NPDC058371 TaxID=3346463 RepID=UPI0036493334